MKLTNVLTSLALSVFGTTAMAMPVDLSTWVVDNSTTNAGRWNLEADNNGVLQIVNGNPTVFHNNQNSQGNALAGTIQVQTFGDDDFIGFVLGFNAGDFSNASADYLLIDWKQGNQTFFGCQASAGLSISQVSGSVGNNTGAWCHDPANNVTELQRATNLGDTGWEDNKEYTFDLVFTPDLVEVSVDGEKELSINGTFSDGSFGFYNYSQASVRYAGITEEVLPPPNVIPLPAAMPLLLAALGGLGFAGWRRRRAHAS